eukprot:TRINITY_DN95648_c0_g1_i1.p1 TRINITY_DN95648_c0_g1~~TRINITY_DN95648_c0_g1_i1.p1  ORF type:complete len:770 (-),score=194.21 TRINITY_DN95648_c0_g1_i1:101-2410(-)
MFLPASRHFEISEETRVALQKHGDFKEAKGRRLNPKAVLKHAKECRNAIRKKWETFDGGPQLLCKKRYYDIAEDRWIEEPVLVQIDRKPFGKGAIRECFRMREVNLQEKQVAGSPTPGSQLSPKEFPADTLTPQASPANNFSAIASGMMELMHSERRRLWVAKRSMTEHADLEAHRRDCSTDVMYQATAKHYAEQYNKALTAKLREASDGFHFAHQIDFLLTHMIELEDGRTFGAEAFLFGDYKKHNNNSGATMGIKKTPQTFSYFTFIHSQRRLMIVDIQGIDDLYTDPVVHFLPSHAAGSFKEADSSVNLGIRGFALFLWSHRYNDVDRALGLPVFPLAMAELQTPLPDERTSIRNLHDGTGVWNLLSVDDTVQTKEGRKVKLSSIPGVDFAPSSWDILPVQPERKAVMPLELVEAACHLEIAAMYHEGRLSKNGEQDKPRTCAELEAAVFHVAQAAKQGLPEAVLALARLASDLDHEDFLPQVISTEREHKLCLSLLEYAAALGVLDAHGALARLMIDGGYCPKGIKELKTAAAHLEAYAAGAAAQEAKKAENEEELKHEVSCKHGCMFGWECHGWEAHTAYARAAELYETDLLKEAGSWETAKELWALAAEVALENPMLAKQAMRYQERADADEPPQQEPAAEAPKLEEVSLRLKVDVAQRFASFAAEFPTQEDALEALLSLHEEQKESKQAAAQAASRRAPQTRPSVKKVTIAPPVPAESDMSTLAPTGTGANSTASTDMQREKEQPKVKDTYDEDVWSMLMPG